MISGFFGPMRFLSNFFEVKVSYNGLIFTNAEAAFQAQKDPNRAYEFVNLGPKQAKSLGRRVHLRSDWDSVKCQIMLDILRAKFADPVLRLQLARTAPQVLIEANTWGDRFWGVCNGSGSNVLGLLLMRVRDEILSSANGNKE